MKCTMHRWHFAFGSMELTVDTSPAQRSPTTNPTPLKPRSIMLRTNCSQLALSSFMLSVTPITSRWPSRSIPMATSTLTFSTCPPRERLRHKPSTNTHGHSPPPAGVSPTHRSRHTHARACRKASARACGRPTAAGRCRRPAGWTRPPGTSPSAPPRHRTRAAGGVRSPPTRTGRPWVRAPSAQACRPRPSARARSGRPGTPSDRSRARIRRRP